MSVRVKLILATILAVLLFSGGVYVGYQIPRTDPQDQMETIFTPYEDGTAKYLEFLDRASQSVYIAGYSFTDDRIADKLIELRANGVKEIHVIMDLEQATVSWNSNKMLALAEKMRKAGIEVVMGTSEKSKEIMHHKYTVVDGIWVEDGSFNYTKLANRQANTLNFVKSKKRAELFMDNWQRMHRFMKAQEAERLKEQGKSKTKSR